MTDRFYALTVVLEKDIREDDAEQIIDAIKMIKHVLNVKGNVSNPDIWTIETRLRHEIGMKLFDVLNTYGKK
jgi:hypothetical protein